MELTIEHRLTKVEEKAEHNSREIEELKPVIKEINTMSKTMVQLVEQGKQTSENIDELKSKVDKIEREPAEEAKAIKKTIITSILTALIGAIIGALISLVVK